MRHGDIARAEDDRRRPALVDEQPHVGAVRLAEQRRPPAERGLDGAGEPDHERVVVGHLGRSEAAPEDLDCRRMLAQPLVAGTGGGDCRPELRFGVAGRLAEPDAVAALGDDPVDDGRGPLAAAHPADDRRVGQAELDHPRVRLGRVPGRLVGLEGANDDLELVERRDTLPAHRGMGGPAGDAQPERDRPGVSGHDVEPRWLGDHGRVAGRPGPDRGQHPLATVLLGRDGDEERLAVEREAGSHDGPDRGERGDDATLHVDRATRVEAPVDDRRLEGTRPPGRLVADRDDVDVADEEDPPRPGSAGPADDDRQLRPLDLAAGEVRVGGDRRRVRGDLVDGQVRLAHPARHEALGASLAAGHARDGAQLGDLGGQAVGIDRRRHGGLAGGKGVSHRAASGGGGPEARRALIGRQPCRAGSAG